MFAISKTNHSISSEYLMPNLASKHAADLELIVEFEGQDAFQGLTKGLYNLEINRKLHYNLQNNKSLTK